MVKHSWGIYGVLQNKKISQLYFIDIKIKSKKCDDECSYQRLKNFTAFTLLLLRKFVITILFLTYPHLNQYDVVEKLE